MVITELAVASKRLLGLGSKLYLSNVLCMLNKDLTRFIQSLSREHQTRASEREALLAGCLRVCYPRKFWNSKALKCISSILGIMVTTKESVFHSRKFSFLDLLINIPEEFYPFCHPTIQSIKWWWMTAYLGKQFWKRLRSLGLESLYNNIISNKQIEQLWIIPAFFYERAAFSSIQLRVARELEISIKNFTYRGALSYFFSDCCSTTATFRTFCHSPWHQKQFISPGILTITTLHKPLPPLLSCKMNCLVTSRCDDKIEPCGGSERFTPKRQHVLKLVKWA